jgi:hypothetical protein
VNLTLPPVTAPYLAAIALLGAAGVAKAIRPGETANALSGAGYPVGPAWVRVGAVAEAFLAVVALLVPGALTGGLVAATYALFAAFIVVALGRGWALSSCGCFGRPDSPPTIAHAVLDVGAAASAVWWAAAWPAGYGFSHLARLFFHQPWHGGPLVVVSAVVAGLAYLVWTDPMPAARRS